MRINILSVGYAFLYVFYVILYPVIVAFRISSGIHYIIINRLISSFSFFGIFRSSKKRRAKTKKRFRLERQQIKRNDEDTKNNNPNKPNNNDETTTTENITSNTSNVANDSSFNCFGLCDRDDDTTTTTTTEDPKNTTTTTIKGSPIKAYIEIVEKLREGVLDMMNKIEKMQEDIELNKQNISAYFQLYDSLTKIIGNLTNEVESNKNNISSNTDSIDKVKIDVQSNNQGITANIESINKIKTDVQTNNQKITSNIEGINKIKTDIESNNQKITLNAQEINKNKLDIQSNKQNLSLYTQLYDSLINRLFSGGQNGILSQGILSEIGTYINSLFLNNGLFKDSLFPPNVVRTVNGKIPENLLPNNGDNCTEYNSNILFSRMFTFYPNENDTEDEVKIRIGQNLNTWKEIMFLGDFEPDPMVEFCKVTMKARYVRVPGVDIKYEWGLSIKEFQLHGHEILDPISSSTVLDTNSLDGNKTGHLELTLIIKAADLQLNEDRDLLWVHKSNVDVELDGTHGVSIMIEKLNEVEVSNINSRNNSNLLIGEHILVKN